MRSWSTSTTGEIGFEVLAEGFSAEHMQNTCRIHAERRSKGGWVHAQLEHSASVHVGRLLASKSDRCLPLGLA